MGTYDRYLGLLCPQWGRTEQAFHCSFPAGSPLPSTCGSDPGRKEARPTYSTVPTLLHLGWSLEEDDVTTCIDQITVSFTTSLSCDVGEKTMCGVTVGTVGRSGSAISLGALALKSWLSLPETSSTARRVHIHCSDIPCGVPSSDSAQDGPCIAGR